MGKQTTGGLYGEELTREIISAAVEVHRHLGPGLLESAYEACLVHELTLRGLPCRKQIPLPVVYKGIELDCGYRLDLVVLDQVVIELKCVDKIAPIHEAQLLSYLRLSNIKIGLILNFHSPRLVDGIKRLIC